jgi:type I thyroxine 5'-deiodinase
MPSNERDHVLLYSPRTDADRFENAGQCVRKLGIRIPALIDGIDDRTELAYTGWPERLYVIAPGGRIVYKSEPGPFGFKPKTMEAHLCKVLGEASRPGLSATRRGADDRCLSSAHRDRTRQATKNDGLPHS